jgi:SEC-C motif-containing protein
MKNCPCGSERGYRDCCGRYLDSGENAPTAEALMRSRYAAYALANIDYITATHDPTTLGEHDPEAARQWAKDSEWLGLEILSTEGGGPADSEGVVEFVARYRNDDGEHEHRERSLFKKREGTWFFASGKVLGPLTVRVEGPRVGRNDPCPCGSGKKFKKCCGRS